MKAIIRYATNDTCCDTFSGPTIDSGIDGAAPDAEPQNSGTASAAAGTPLGFAYAIGLNPALRVSPGMTHG
jgi:hypothetical protein